MTNVEDCTMTHQHQGEKKCQRAKWSMLTADIAWVRALANPRCNPWLEIGGNVGHEELLNYCLVQCAKS